MKRRWDEEKVGCLGWSVSSMLEPSGVKDYIFYISKYIITICIVWWQKSYLEDFFLKVGFHGMDIINVF